MSRAFIFKTRVYYEDTDAAGIVYHANYLKYMERARTEWLRELGFCQSDLARRYGIGFVVRRAQLEYLAAARFDMNLEVSVRIVRCGYASIECEQAVAGSPDRVCCTGMIRVGCADLKRMAATRMPAEVYAKIRDAH